MASEDESNADAGPGAAGGFHLGRFLRNAVLIVGAIALAVWVWDDAIKDNLFPRNFGTVVEGELYRSGRLTPMATRTVVERHGIQTIVDLGAYEPGSPEERRAQATADELGVDRVRFDLEGDATGDPNNYVSALRIMSDPARRPVLIHCAAGSERTGCAVALFRYLYEGVSIDDAYAETRSHKHDAGRNPHLRPMLERWADEIGRSLETGEPIEYDPLTHGQGGALRLAREREDDDG